jgi:NADP-reducing hydrogenase subunit HndB
MSIRTIQSLEDLNLFRAEIVEAKQQQARLAMVQVIVSLGTCGIAAGALDTLKAIQQQVAANHLETVHVSHTGCAGLCKYEPMIEVIAADSAKVTYGHVTPEVARRIFREHVQGGKVVEEYVVEA